MGIVGYVSPLGEIGTNRRKRTESVADQAGAMYSLPKKSEGISGFKFWQFLG